jgi:PAS domain S-box-containing protein
MPSNVDETLDVAFNAAETSAANAIKGVNDMKFDPSEILNASILIVDDQWSNVHLLERLLGDAGYVNVSSTTDAREVCALHRKKAYDLILLDLQMPEMDGFQVMVSLRSNEAESYLPVIVLTAQPGHKVRALQCGAKDFISKPFDLIEVKTRIHNMLEVRLLYNKLKKYSELLEQTVLERTAELRESEARYRCLTELACDWYWEQDETGRFTKVGGPVLEMLGIAVNDLAGKPGEAMGGWDEIARMELQTRIAARQPFLDFVVGRVNSNGSQQRYQISGQPIFDCSCGYKGYRGIGVELTAVPPSAQHVLS